MKQIIDKKAGPNTIFNIEDVDNLADEDSIGSYVYDNKEEATQVCGLTIEWKEKITAKSEVHNNNSKKNEHWKKMRKET